MARKRTKATDSAAERYPHVARWCNQHGWIEVGFEWQDELFARAIHEGGGGLGRRGSVSHYRRRPACLGRRHQGLHAGERLGIVDARGR